MDEPVADGTVAQTPDGTAAESAAQGLGFKAQFSDPLKNHEAFTKMTKIDELGNAYLDSLGKIRDYEGKLTETIPKPKENATKEEQEAFYKAIGRPEKPDGYEFEKITPPEGVTLDDNIETWFKGLAHQAGLTKSQAAMLHKEYTTAYINANKEVLAKRQQELQKGMETLKNDWKDKFQENAAVVDKVMSRFGTPEFKKYADESGLGNNPHLVKVFYEIGRAMADDTFVPGKPAGSDGRQPGTLHYQSMEK